MSMMIRSEREDLQRLVRQRERVLKSAAKQRSADLIADFENQMGSEYSFDQDEVWTSPASRRHVRTRLSKFPSRARARETWALHPKVSRVPYLFAAGP